MVNIELNAILMQKGWERMGKDGKGTRCRNFLCSSFNRQLGLDASTGEAAAVLSQEEG